MINVKHHPIDIDGKLAARGLDLTETNIQRVQFYHKRAYKGWIKPVYDLDTWEIIGSQFKNARRNGAKYLPLHSDGRVGKPDHPHFDWIIEPDAIQAIAEAGGVCYLANGWPAAETFRTLGIKNVICTTAGETTVPVNVVEILRKIGVTRLIFIIDNDYAGYLSAIAWREPLRGSGLDFVPLTWGLKQVDKVDIDKKGNEKPYIACDDVPEKADANDIWIMLKFDANDFIDRLDNLPTLELPEPKPKKAEYKASELDPDYERAKDQRKQDVARSLGLTHFNDAGWATKNVLVPFRKDKTPTGGYNINSGSLLDRATGITYTLWDLCQYFGFEYPKRKRKEGKRPNNIQKSKESPIGEYPMSQWPNPVTLPPFTADIQVNLRYISELSPRYFCYKTLLIRSPLNTGKTTLVERILEDFEKRHGRQARVLVITHGQALTDDIARRLNLHSYRDIPADQPELAKSLDRVVSSYDSLWLFDGCEFDIIFIDETEAFHPHIGSGTMSGAEAQRNYKTLKGIIKSAGQVVAADAHMSNLSRKWFESIRGEVIGIENTYRHEWGKVIITKDMARTIGKALEKAHKNIGSVVIPTNSRTLADQLYIIFKDEIGTGVRLITGWNSANKENQAFIRNINEELAKTRVLIVSPAIADGTDVQTTVAGVYGVFTRNIWGSASSILQQMMRYRNASERYLYIQPTFEGTEETDWRAIYLRYMRQIEGTAKVANFDAHALETSNETQRAILRLTSMFQAQRAEQRNNIFSFTVAFAKDEGFDIAYDETENKLIRERLKLAREQLSEEQKEKTVTLEPISPDEFDDIRRKGLVTHDDNYALLRYKIEYTAGQGITPELYNLLKTSQNRADFNRFCDLFENETKLQEKDRAQADASELIARRRHYTRNMQLIAQIMKITFGRDWLHNQESLTEQEITERLQPYVDEHFHEIEMYLDTRKGLSPEALNVLRRIAKRGGMKLSSKQVMVNGERYYVYWLDEEHLERMYELAKIALSARREREAEKQSKLLNSVSTPIKYTNLSNQPGKKSTFDTDVGVSVMLATGEQITIPF